MNPHEISSLFNASKVMVSSLHRPQVHSCNPIPRPFGSNWQGADHSDTLVNPGASDPLQPLYLYSRIVQYEFTCQNGYGARNWTHPQTRLFSKSTLGNKVISMDAGLDDFHFLEVENELLGNTLAQ